ncbi:Regulator of chromosome condensation (RCC1) family with FYVE zinc finger domain isoform 3 [Populus alba x Populus x berolinensis]|nr:Regulator of chromosome condensation (RCC1) family with FYVE zinc finger domain isoform 3 [Populus alba x Populus x berolinensis]
MLRGDRMASDLGRTGPVERDIEQAITALKKGAYLLKYGRRGKPKFCPFRLSSDESVLIWFSGKEEKHLRLSHVSRIVSGQRTICKDKDEAEVWFSGLKALISRSNHQKGRTESRSDGIPSEANSPRTYTRRSSPLNSPLVVMTSIRKSPKNGLDKAFSDVVLYAVPPKGFFPSDSASGSVHSLSSGGSDSVHGHMKAMAVDAFRVSLSSAVSSLSQVVLDVQNIACGGQHAALVTKQGEFFSWGEESGAGLGMEWKRGKSLGSKKSEWTLGRHTCLFHLLWTWHTAVVTSAGQLFTFGDGTFGVLGHGDRKSISLPKEVESLKGLRTVQAACGVWHTAAVIEVMVGNSSSSNCSSGKLFTWGDGDKGRLGHGDKEAKFWFLHGLLLLLNANFCQVCMWNIV